MQIDTTPTIEFWFCVDPVGSLAKLRLTEWPRDGRLKHTGRPGRKPIPLADFAVEAARINTQLERLGVGTLNRESLIALRLFTGPMGERYQAVLRGAELARSPTYLQLGSLASSTTSLAALASLSSFRMTIHAINDSLSKLGRLAPASERVYRGVAMMGSGGSRGGSSTGGASRGADATTGGGDQLPASLPGSSSSWVEVGFLQATLDRERALAYAQSASGFVESGVGGAKVPKTTKAGRSGGVGGGGTGDASGTGGSKGLRLPSLYEMRGNALCGAASLHWVSQYPHEMEAAFPCLSAFVVADTPRVEGSVVVVECHAQATKSSRGGLAIGGGPRLGAACGGSGLGYGEVRSHGVAEEAAALSAGQPVPMSAAACMLMTGEGTLGALAFSEAEGEGTSGSGGAAGGSGAGVGGAGVGSGSGASRCAEEEMLEARREASEMAAKERFDTAAAAAMAMAEATEAANAPASRIPAAGGKSSTGRMSRGLRRAVRAASASNALAARGDAKKAKNTSSIAQSSPGNVYGMR